MTTSSPKRILYVARVWGAVLLIVAGFAGIAQAQETIPDTVTSLPTDIQSVVSGGYWSNGDKEGFFRAVVVAGGVEHVGMNLYLQWLGVDVDSGITAPLATVPVAEVNTAYSGERVFDVAIDKKAEFGTLHLVVTVSQSTPQLETRFDLITNGEIGTYAVTKAE